MVGETPRKKSLIPQTPIEEKSFKSIWPDLNVKDKLALVMVRPHPLQSNGKHKVEPIQSLPPIPFSPQKPIPKPRFVQLETLKTRKSSLDFSRFLIDYSGKLPCFIKVPLEKEIWDTIEYDMDDHGMVLRSHDVDKQWLQGWNQRQPSINLSMDQFEFLMDLIEKEWFEFVFFFFDS